MARNKLVDIPDGVERFFELFRHVAPQYKWHLEGGYRIRTTIQHGQCCPLIVLGHFRTAASPADRYVPAIAQIETLCNLRDKALAAIIHNADDIGSRYYRPEIRNRLLAMCNLLPKSEELNDAVMTASAS